MAIRKGSEVLIQAGNGAPTEIFTTLGGLQATRFALSNQPLDAGSLGSGAWRTLLQNAGTRSITLSGKGIFTDAASEETVRSRAFSNSVGNYRFLFGSGDSFTGPFQITAYERSGDPEGAETYAVTFESAGAVSVVMG